MVSDEFACLTHMDYEFLHFLAEVKALMPISHIVGLLKTRLFHDGHDIAVRVLNFLHVVPFAVAFDIIVSPSFDLTEVLHPGL